MRINIKNHCAIKACQKKRQALIKVQGLGINKNKGVNMVGTNKNNDKKKGEH